MKTGTQIFAILVTLPYLLTIIRLIRRDALRAKYSFLWLLVGTAIIVISFVPGLLDTMAGWVGIAYPPALIFFGAITLLLVIALHFSWELSRMEERTRVLAEELALLRARAVHPAAHPVEARAVYVDRPVQHENGHTPDDAPDGETLLKRAGGAQA